MEDQKKKYLLNRIKKQQLVLQSYFDKFKRVFQNRTVPDERNESYTELLCTLVDHNNEFAIGLIEYLQKNQIKDVFERSSAAFNDLLDKYKKLYQNWKNLEEGKDIRQIRQICQICQEKIESNHIQNIKNILDRQAEARSNLIKKLIEQTEKERVKPLFTREEDEFFKQQLDKVLKKKETSLENNLQQSNIFLQTVTKQISDFMISFRNEFATWEHSNVQENVNWAQTMKGYLNKKLTNSFQEKIPKWIKKMHDYFVFSQPVKPKIYFANREIQTALPSDQQNNLRKQVEELKKKLQLKRQKLKQLFTKIQMQKTKSLNLEKQLSKMQKYMVQKIYQAKADKKNENKAQIIRQTKKIVSPKDQKEPMVNFNSSRLKQIKQIPKGSILPSKLIKSVQKLVKTPINKFNSKLNLQQTQKQNISKDQKQNSLLHSNKQQKLQIEIKQAQIKSSQNNSMKNFESNTKRNNKNEILRKSLGQSEINQTNIRLKKKGYNREKRQEIINDKNQEPTNKQAKSIHNTGDNNNFMKMSKVQLQDEVKNISQILKSSSHKKLMSYSQVKITENESKISLKQNKISNQERIDIQLHENQIENLQNQIVNKSVINQQVVVQGQLELKMKNYLKSFRKGRKKGDLQQILHLLSKQLNQKPTETNVLENILSNKSLKENIRKLKNIQYMSIIKPRHKIQEKDEKYCRSLHVDRNIQSKHKILRLPKIVKNDLHKFQEQQVQSRQIIEQSCLNLFIDGETAYFYQQSLSESNKAKRIVKPTSAQLQAIELLFSEIEVVKKNNKATYTQIISFLKHPFTAIKCKFLTLDSIHELSFQAFCNYFLKILWLHRNCVEKQNQHFCGHLTAFKKQMKLLSLK